MFGQMRRAIALLNQTVGVLSPFIGSYRGERYFDTRESSRFEYLHDFYQTVDNERGKKNALRNQLREQMQASVGRKRAHRADVASGGANQMRPGRALSVFATAD